MSHCEDTFPKVGGCSFGLKHPRLRQPASQSDPDLTAYLMSDNFLLIGIIEDIP